MLDCADKVVRNKPLYGMFAAIPQRYDLINHIITWGLDVRWRWQAAKVCLATQPKKVLDLCCGTGDMAINIARLAKNEVELTGIDYSQPMLERAGRKAELLAKGKKISFTCGDAATLPFLDGYFDCVDISFAFRNLTYKNPLAQRYLAEVLRVLGSNGRFVIVETSQPKIKIIRKLFHLYVRWFAYRVGYLLSGNRGAYHYLADSATRFYTAAELEELLVTAGFREVSCRPFLFGAVSIYVAVK